MTATRRHPDSVDSRMLARIRRRGPGAVLVPGDVLDLGTREEVDLALHRLAKAGTNPPSSTRSSVRPLTSGWTVRGRIR